MGKKTSKPWDFWKCYSNSVLLFMAATTIIIVMETARRTTWPEKATKSETVPKTMKNKTMIHKDHSSCDMFSGRWVYDNATHPLYSGLTCKYMIDEIACDKFERKDLGYQRWRWQPNGCKLPRFEAKAMLERLRNKRMVYVGDSLNRNQWVSMVCILESSIASDDQKSYVSSGSILSFKAKEYNATVDFYWSPVLLESNCDDPVHHRVSDRVMRANAIEKHAKNWADADILVFNSYLWWKKPNMKMKVLYGSFDDEEKKYQEMEMIDGFELALKAWADWVEMHLDTVKKKVFFMSMSPTHVWGGNWGRDGQNCYGETEPITDEGYIGRGSDYPFLKAVATSIEGLKTKGKNVQMLNITQLSVYRKDGHPSIYRKHWDKLSEAQLANPSSYADCTHWCLPGVPDVWNEILYAYIMSK